MNASIRNASVSGLALSAAAFATASPKDESRAALAALRADAAHRTSLLTSDASAGPRGFKISDANGDYSLKVAGQSQTRYNINLRGMAPAGEEDTTMGFNQRRSKLEFSGNVHSPDWRYKIVGGFDRNGGAFVLEDAVMTHVIDENLSVQAGQFKLPFWWEENVSSKRQLAVDRSPTNETFNQDRSQAIQVNYLGDDFRFMGAFSDGFNTDNTPFNSAAEADFAFTGRGEWKWGQENGSFRRFDDFTSWTGSEYAGKAGAAIHFQTGGETGAVGGATTDTDLLSFTVDAQAEGDGWNAFAAFVWRNTDPAATASTDDMGILAQGGLFLDDNNELFGRYDVVIPDDANGDPFNTITFGVNHYVIPESHAVKFSLDVQVFLDEQSMAGIVSANEGINLLADTDAGQVAVRGQGQILF